MLEWLFVVWLLAVMPGTGLASEAAENRQLSTATFAGGCFWCMEEVFEGVEGVVSVTSGYTGGHAVNPSYEDVSAGGTGHAEAVEVVYDSTKV
ncbi:MAG: peptide-methionine (S)-S-oxide reductase, partial [Nitrospirae bacterium]|nr:peptide-methionine (S)-S-oxide reductase [Nitrospirota bacterium]